MGIEDKIINSLLTNRYIYETNQTEEEIDLKFKEITKSVSLF